MNDEGLIFVPQYLIEEAIAGSALVAKDASLASARVDQEAKRQGQVGFPREVANGLRPAVLVEHEIVLDQIAD